MNNSSLNDKACREAFEHFCLCNGYAGRIVDGKPQFESSDWELWQAAIASRPTPIAGLDELLVELGECFPKTLRQHIAKIPTENVMMCARQTLRIVNALLVLARTHGVEKVKLEDVAVVLDKAAWDCDHHKTDEEDKKFLRGVAAAVLEHIGVDYE